MLSATVHWAARGGSSRTGTSVSEPAEASGSNLTLEKGDGKDLAWALQRRNAWMKRLVNVKNGGDRQTLRREILKITRVIGTLLGVLKLHAQVASSELSDKLVPDSVGNMMVIT